MKTIALHNGHDASITAFEGSRIIFHLELERFLNIKHFNGLHNGDAVCRTLLEHVLPKLGWHVADLDAVVLAGIAPWDWRQTSLASATRDVPHPRPPGQLHVEWEAEFAGRRLAFAGVNHHVGHLAYSYFTSPFSEAALLAVDGLGDHCVNTAFGVGRGGQLDYLGDLTHANTIGVPYNSIGLVYSTLGKLFPFLGDCPLATAGKAMGLSSYGKPRAAWRTLVRRCLERDTPPGSDDPMAVGSTFAAYADLRNELHLPFGDPTACEVHDLMATIQDEFEQYLCKLVDRLVKRTGLRSLCLGGGCALNVLANSRLLREGIIDRLYVPPACSDAGLSIGAGLHYYYREGKSDYRGTPFHDPYQGDEMAGQEQLASSDAFPGVRRQRLPRGQLLTRIAEDLAAGRTTAWAQGRAEIGPRALGNRSILCAPFPATMKDRLNAKVKRRESWRPFGPVCLAEAAGDWFAIDHAQPYMLEAPLVHPAMASRIPAVVHCDGTARVQTVALGQNDMLRDLVTSFAEITGIPILLNTSLNGNGLPIANHASAVLDLLTGTDLDVAAIGDWYCERA